MINRAELKMRAKNDMSGNMGMLIVCMVIVAALAGACSLVPYVGTIGSVCVTGPLSLGMAYVYLNCSVDFSVLWTHWC